MWNPVIVWYIMGVFKCTISDPKILKDIDDDRSCYVKFAVYSDIVMDPRTMDNLINKSNCPEQVKRRRTMQNGVSAP